MLLKSTVGGEQQQTWTGANIPSVRPGQLAVPAEQADGKEGDCEEQPDDGQAGEADRQEVQQDQAGERLVPAEYIGQARQPKEPHAKPVFFMQPNGLIYHSRWLPSIQIVIHYAVNL